VDVCLLGQSLHSEGHLLLVDEFSNVHDVGVDIMAAVLLLEEAGGAGEPFSALGVLAEVLDGFGGMLGTADLVVQLLSALHFDLALH
jgi:hypothetical protein